MTKKPERAKPLTAEDLFHLLEERYPIPSWALLPQVANMTGGGSRYADGIAMSCWPSMGMEVHGFEIKCYRGDWLHEIRNGQKSQPIFKFCDRWWIVVPNKAMVEEGELPPTWGLMDVQGGKLKVVVNAPKLKPEPLNRMFIASVLRNSLKVATPKAKLENEYKRGLREGRKQGEESAKLDGRGLEQEVTNLRRAIRTFEKHAGVKFPEVSRWWDGKQTAEELGQAIRIVLSGDALLVKKQLLQLRNLTEGIMKDIDMRLTAALEPPKKSGKP